MRRRAGNVDIMGVMNHSHKPAGLNAPRLYQVWSLDCSTDQEEYWRLEAQFPYNQDDARTNAASKAREAAEAGATVAIVRLVEFETAERFKDKWGVLYHVKAGQSRALPGDGVFYHDAKPAAETPDYWQGRKECAL